MLVCLTCWEVYDSDVMNRVGSEQLWCPKRSCSQELVDLDECLIPVIKELNEKGYFTVSCCSGHFYYNQYSSGFYADTHIQFDDSVRREDLRDLPPGFNIEADKGHVGTTIRKKYDIEDPMELHIEILKTAIDLTKWARGLEGMPSE